MPDNPTERVEVPEGVPEEAISKLMEWGGGWDRDNAIQALRELQPLLLKARDDEWFDRWMEREEQFAGEAQAALAKAEELRERLLRSERDGGLPRYHPRHDSSEMRHDSAYPGSPGVWISVYDLEAALPSPESEPAEDHDAR